MKFLRRKAGVKGFLILLIISLFSLVLILLLWGQMFDVYNAKKQKMLCKDAMYINSLNKVKGKDFLQMFQSHTTVSDVPCRTSNVEVKGSDKESTMKQLALYLYDSWDMFHRGRLEFFSGNEPGDETYCILTHIVSFDDDAKRLGQINGFIDYLDTTASPYLDSRGERISYSKYLQSYCTTIPPDMSVAPSELNKDDYFVDTSLDYGIFFVYAKETKMQKLWASWEGLKAGTAFGAGVVLFVLPDAGLFKGVAYTLVFGAAGTFMGYELGSDESARWCSTVMLVPLDENHLNSFKCTYMPGIQSTRGSS